MCTLYMLNISQQLEIEKKYAEQVDFQTEYHNQKAYLPKKKKKDEKLESFEMWCYAKCKLEGKEIK